MQGNMSKMLDVTLWGPSLSEADLLTRETHADGFCVREFRKN